MVSVSVPHACSVRRNCPHGFVHNLWLLVELLGGAKGHCTACSRFQAAQRELAGSAVSQAARAGKRAAAGESTGREHCRTSSVGATYAKRAYKRPVARVSVLRGPGTQGEHTYFY